MQIAMVPFGSGGNQNPEKNIIDSAERVFPNLFLLFSNTLLFKSYMQ